MLTVAYRLCVHHWSSAQSSPEEAVGPSTAPRSSALLWAWIHSGNDATFQLWNRQAFCTLGHPLQCTCLRTRPEPPQWRWGALPSPRRGGQQLSPAAKLEELLLLHTLPTTAISRPAFCKRGLGDLPAWRQRSRKQMMNREILLSGVVLRGAAEHSSAIRLLRAP